MTPEKLLRVIRFDESDANVFDLGANSGEWAVSGSFAFAPESGDLLVGKARQAFANGWLGLTTFGRSTFVTIARISEAEFIQATDALCRHMMDVYGAPDEATARAAALDELAFSADLAQDAPVNTVLAIRRRREDNGETHEEVRIIDVPQRHFHTRVWDVVEDET